MNASLLALLRRDNPWLERPGAWDEARRTRVPGAYLPRLQPDVLALSGQALPTEKAVLVVGPRQAGKSTWVWRRLLDLPPAVLYLDCELPLVRQWCSDPTAVLEDLRLLLPQPAAVFLEEAQHLADAGLFIKGLIDRRLGCPLLVTGSSSYHLHANTRESLAGRARRARLLPFSLAEVTGDLAGLPPLLRRAARRERLERHLVVGGYPAAWLGTDPAAELAGLVEALVVRDASDLYRVQRPDAFRTLLQLAARQTGSLVNLSEWAAVAGVSVPTVSSYLDLLEESHLLVQVPVHAGGKRAEITSARKVYFVDPGLRNLLAGDLRPFSERSDRGPLLESWVFAELHKDLPFGSTLAYWRTRSGAEVDFVVREGDSLVGIEVKASPQARPALSRSARSFIEAYGPSRFLVVNLGVEHAERLGETAVEWIHPADLVERVRAR